MLKKRPMTTEAERGGYGLASPLLLQQEFRDTDYLQYFVAILYDDGGTFNIFGSQPSALDHDPHSHVLAELDFSFRSAYRAACSQIVKIPAFFVLLCFPGRCFAWSYWRNRSGRSRCSACPDESNASTLPTP